MNIRNSLSEVPIESKKIISVSNSKRDIKSSYKRTFIDKSNKWKLQDEEVELKKLNDIKKQKEISSFLKQIKQLARSSQYYVDGYSKKNGVTNQRINQFSQSLNSAFHSKKVIENKAIQFNDKANSISKVISLQKKEKRQLKEGDVVSRKIRQNFECEDMPEDVDLNYQVFAQRIEGRNNEQKVDPYQEFLDFKAQVALKESAIVVQKNVMLPSQSLGQSQGKGILNPSKSMKSVTNNFESPFFDKRALSRQIGDLNKNYYLERSIHPNRHHYDTNMNNMNENKDMKYILIEKVKNN